MAQFHEAFFFLAEGADPAERTVHDSGLTRTVLVPVPDADAAAAAAADLLAGGLDLIELYGGLGLTSAAAVIAATGGQVPVGLVGAEHDRPVRNRAAIFEAMGADPAKDRYVHEHAGGRMTIVAVPDPAAVPAAAVELVAEGAECIELCGGLGPIPAAGVIEAVDGVPVNAVMFGFESLPGAAAYRARFERALAA